MSTEPAEKDADVGEDGTDLLKVPQVAKLLNVSEPTVWRLLRSGELDSIRVGARSRRVSPAAVDDYKQSHSKRGRAAA